MNNTIPEQARLTYDVEKSTCENCFESLLFHLKDSTHEFTIGLIDVLKCIKFAEEEGSLPELPPEWWIDVKNHYQME